MAWYWIVLIVVAAIMFAFLIVGGGCGDDPTDTIGY
jgi:hypothetical protein